MLASLSDDSIAPSDLLTLSPRLGESWREGPHQPRDCLARGARLITEPVPASLSRSCPRSFDCVRDAHSLRMTNQERWQAVRCLARDADSLRMTTKAAVWCAMPRLRCALA